MDFYSQARGKTRIYIEENQLPVTPKGMNQPLISPYSGLNSPE
jgi:hypothetical protein